MAYYYVKNGGTATGDAGRSTSPRTGGFSAMGASNYYGSLYDVFAGGIPATVPNGDIIIISHSHSETVSSTLELNVQVSYYTNMYLSVDDSDVTIYSKGATLNASGLLTLGAATSQKRSGYFKGIIINAPSGMTLNNRESLITFDSCEVDCGSTGFLSNYDSVRFKDSIVEFSLLFGGNVFIEGGSLSAHYWVGIFSGTDEVHAIGCDFSGSTSSSLHSNRVVNVVRLESCKIPTSWLPLNNYQNETQSSPFLIEAIGCGTDNKYYSHVRNTHEALIELTDQVGLNYSEEANNLSYLIASRGYVSKAKPARCKLIEMYAQDLSKGDTTYRVNLLLDTGTVSSLSDSEFWVDVFHTDNNDLVNNSILSSRNEGVVVAGSELALSSEVWQGNLPAGLKAYHVDVQLDASTLANVTLGSVKIYVNLGVANADVYVCPAVQVGT